LNGGHEVAILQPGASLVEGGHEVAILQPPQVA